MKLLVLDNIGSFSLAPYLDPYIKERIPNFEIWKMGNILSDEMWAIYARLAPDVVFVDFCNENAIVLTNKVKELPKQPKIVIRLHRYEAHGSYMQRVDWSAVSSLVVVSPPYHDIVVSKVPSIAEKVHTVANGIDMAKFQLQDAATMDSTAIAYAGYWNWKKGMTLLRTLMASLPDRHFHMAGAYQDEHIQQYMEDVPMSNATYMGWTNTAEFLKGKRFVISTSLTESFGMSIAEGMAMGLTPLVHRWPGADRIWPQKCLWTSFDELKALLANPKDPAWCRAWIEDRYSMDRCVQKIAALLF